MGRRSLTFNGAVIASLMMEKQRPRKVSTIDGLARLMQEEFVGVNGKFEGVNRRFDGVHAEFSRVHKRLDAVENGLRDMKESSSELFAKLDAFISLYRDTKQELALLARQFRRLEARVAQLESKR